MSAHLGGLAWHTLRHKDDIAKVMITGKRTGRPEDGISLAHPAWGGVVLAVSILWIAALFTGYDSRGGAVRLPLTGTSLQLCTGDHDRGEAESRANFRSARGKGLSERGERKGHHGRGKHDDD